MKVFCNHSVLDSSRSHQHNANTGSITYQITFLLNNARNEGVHCTFIWYFIF